MRIILLGPPGAGKGTQATKIASTRKLAHLSTGEMLRAAVAAKSKLGKQVQAIMAKGDLVPDELVTSLIEERLDAQDCARGFVLDGFPRTKAQAKALDAMLAEKNLALNVVLELQVDDQCLLARVHSRLAQSGKTPRQDDTPKALKTRLEVYHERTTPIATHYAEQNLLRSINGMNEIEEVTEEIDCVLKEEAGVEG